MPLIGMVLSAPAPSFDVNAVMTSAVNSVTSDLYGVLGIAVPALVGLVGACVAIRFGIKWLKSLKSA